MEHLYKKYNSLSDNILKNIIDMKEVEIKEKLKEIHEKSNEVKVIREILFNRETLNNKKLYGAQTKKSFTYSKGITSIKDLFHLNSNDSNSDSNENLEIDLNLNNNDSDSNESSDNNFYEINLCQPNNEDIYTIKHHNRFIDGRHTHNYFGGSNSISYIDSSDDERMDLDYRFKMRVRDKVRLKRQEIIRRNMMIEQHNKMTHDLKKIKQIRKERFKRLESFNTFKNHRGIINLGVFCYINSLFQSMSKVFKNMFIYHYDVITVYKLILKFCNVELILKEPIFKNKIAEILKTRKKELVINILTECPDMTIRKIDILIDKLIKHQIDILVIFNLKNIIDMLSNCKDNKKTHKTRFKSDPSAFTNFSKEKDNNEYQVVTDNTNINCVYSSSSSDSDSDIRSIPKTKKIKRFIGTNEKYAPLYIRYFIKILRYHLNKIGFEHLCDGNFNDSVEVLFYILNTVENVFGIPEELNSFEKELDMKSYDDFEKLSFKEQKFKKHEKHTIYLKKSPQTYFTKFVKHRINQYDICIECKHISTKTIDSDILLLGEIDEHMKCIKDVVDKYCESELIKRCSNCKTNKTLNGNKHISIYRFTNISDNIIIQLKLNHYDDKIKDEVVRKRGIDYNIRPEFKIDFKDLYEKDFIVNSSYEYNLNSIIYFDPHISHYYSYIKTDDGIWIKCNDHVVERVTTQDIINDNNLIFLLNYSII